MMQLEDLKEKLADIDVFSLVEQLDLTTKELLYYLEDAIIEKQRELAEWLLGEEDDNFTEDDA